MEFCSDAYETVETDEQWALKSPADGSIQQTISARNLWIRLLTARAKQVSHILFILIPLTGKFHSTISWRILQ